MKKLVAEYYCFLGPEKDFSVFPVYISHNIASKQKKPTLMYVWYVFGGGGAVFAMVTTFSLLISIQKSQFQAQHEIHYAH